MLCGSNNITNSLKPSPTVAGCATSHRFFIYLSLIGYEMIPFKTPNEKKEKRRKIKKHYELCVQQVC